MIAAAVITVVAGALLPHALERLAALPMGAALLWLAYSLWSNRAPAA
jgi:purine-cytosine permease-like protein